MKLSVCLAPWINGLSEEGDVSGLENDTRQVRPGDAFVAYPGSQVDGRHFVKVAVEKGASAIIYEATDSERFQNEWASLQVPKIAMASLEAKMGKIAARFYQNPAEKLSIVGVTGTNGKTTVSYHLAHMKSALGQASAYLGTLGYGNPPHISELVNTTPDALQLQKILHEFVQLGIQHVFMEVSSHALALGRTEDIPFQQAIFTNLTHEHLDFHHTMEAYREAKAKLFATPGLQTAILNGDDTASSFMQEAIASTQARIFSYGFQKNQHIQVLNHEITLQGSVFAVKTPWGEGKVSIPSVGKFNIYNALAVLACLGSQGHSWSSLVTEIAKLPQVPGRMEVVNKRPYVIVDYAHKPDALEHVLKTLRQLSQHKIIVVFGCGGNRDRGKRLLMGKIASECADVVVITNDNPREEDPNEIIREVIQGVLPGKPTYVIPDRKEAIEKAMLFANAEDIILVAGKGHESYQQIGRIQHPFSDQRVIKTILEGKV